MTVNTTQTQKVDLWWLNIAIVFAFMFILGHLIPPVGSLTKIGINVACVFIGLIYGWGFCGILWPSLMGILALGFTGLYTVPEIIVQGFGNDTVIFVLLMLIVVENLNDVGVTKIFSSWLLSRPFLQGKPWLFSAMMLFVAYIVTALSNNFVAIFLVWGMWASIFKEYGYKPFDKYVTLMMAGTIIGVTLGSFVFPFRNAPMIMLSAFAKISAGSVNYAAYLISVIPFTLLLFIEYILICKYIFKPDVSRIAEIKVSDFAAKEKMGARQIVSTGAFLMVVLSLLVPSFLPSGSWLKVTIGSFGLSGLAIAALLVLMLVRIEGKAILDFNKIARKGVMWDAIFMVVVIMLLSPILSHEATGITPFIVQTLTPLLGGHSAYVFMLIFAGALLLLTNIFNNMIMGFLFIPIVATFSGIVGIDPWVLMALLCVAMHLAILTPSASGQVGMLFGNTEWVHSQDLYKITIITFICWGVSLLSVGIFFISNVFKLFG